MNTPPAGEPLADRRVEVEVSAPEILAAGYRSYERYRLTLPRAGRPPLAQTRDIVRGGEVVGVLAIDPARGELVLIRQFRLPAHLAIGKGELVEIVAGRVDPGESPVTAARRECVEEIGVAPSRLIELVAFLPTPGVTDEHATLFLGVVDSDKVCERGGATEEAEETVPVRVTIDEALEALTAGRLANGFLVIALQWLALNRHRLDQMLRSAESVSV